MKQSSSGGVRPWSLSWLGRRDCDNNTPVTDGRSHAYQSPSMLPARAIGLLSIVAMLLAGLLFYPIRVWPTAAARLSVHAASSLDKQVDTGSAVTGRLFKGERVRQYTGQHMLADAAASVATTTLPEGLGGSIQSSKWAVCTTIFKPSDATLRAVALKVISTGRASMQPQRSLHCADSGAQQCNAGHNVTVVQLQPCKAMRLTAGHAMDTEACWVCFAVMSVSISDRLTSTLL